MRRKNGFIHRLKRNSRSIAFIALIIFLFVTWAGSTVLEILRLSQLKADLTEQIAERQETNSQLDEEIAQIGSQAYIERIARKYLGLYYPNEQIIIPVENIAQAEESTGKSADIKSEDSDSLEDATVAPSIVTDEEEEYLDEESQADVVEAADNEGEQLDLLRSSGEVSEDDQEETESE